MTILDKVLTLDLENLTEEEIAYLHKLKNLATVMTGRLALKHAQDNEFNYE